MGFGLLNDVDSEQLIDFAALIGNPIRSSTGKLVRIGVREPTAPNSYGRRSGAYFASFLRTLGFRLTIISYRYGQCSVA